MLVLDVINQKKKGKVTGRTFNLFIINPSRSILIEGTDFVEPIMWGTKNGVAYHLTHLDKIIFKGTKDTTVTIYTYKWTDMGWALFTGAPWVGKISDITEKNW